ncbi:O-methyltransferase [Legionella santicrucis]|uniref:O-methyltransferase n=1 Tax=Legionella santicrucis TaxID=45074 RepID=A0A0W0Y921_9GAMM|nr:class I SAM-dependent methyltransferase [Legionella santicrucis]KTD53457.1 O-methyltransferase [Legionella santicrucis]
MFHDISPAILRRMSYLENRDKLEMLGQVEIKHFNKLRQIPPETGRFISLLAASVPDGKWLEIGTSAGYSTLWLSLACKYLKTNITTFELDPQKIALAKETFALAEVEDYAELIAGDVFEHLETYKDVSFCFLDTEKELYTDCYEIVIPNMVPGGILLADNVVSHQSDLQPMIDRALGDNRVDALIVPIGQGVLLCKKL